MDLRRFGISEEGIITAHIIKINRLAQKRRWSFHQELFRLKGFAQFVKAKAGVQISSRGMWRHTTKLPAHPQGARPSFFAHQMVQTHLQNFGTILRGLFNGIKLGNRFAVHAKFGITGGCT